MDVSKYFQRAMTLVSSSELEGTELSVAIKEDLKNEEDNSPNHWIPLVQDKLLKAANLKYPSEISDQLLKLYMQGYVLHNGYVKKSSAILVAIISALLGLLVSWSIWT
ncbi:hypothetical protein [Pseudoalteromonas sp. Ld20]|uniref:hypothetical protein n=1 Tax=Pseudoalteromonas sp. Ld20 TaxID=649165 RepID=UPI0038686461